LANNQAALEFLSGWAQTTTACTSSGSGGGGGSGGGAKEQLAGLVETALRFIMHREFTKATSSTSSTSTSNNNGAVLVFLSGWDEIEAVMNHLTTSSFSSSSSSLPACSFGDSQQFLILPLHSQLPSKAQRAVFALPPKGVTKIVLATNVAETSITIPDIIVVGKLMCCFPPIFVLILLELVSLQ
jgi:hypothetical protein